MSTSIFIELHFLPSLDYFISYLNAETVYIDLEETYQKQTYRNRTYLLGANSILVRTVPVHHSHGSGKIRTKDIRIDYSQLWLSGFLRSVKSSYGKAPYFEYYYDLFEAVFYKKIPFLWELNIELLTICLKLLDVPNNLIIKDKKSVMDYSENKNLTNCINPKKIPYNKDILARLSYTQTFGKDFVNNLSIMDLLFSEGNHALNLLRSAIRVGQLNESSRRNVKP